MPVHPLGQALFSLSPEFIGIARAGRGRTGIPTSRIRVNLTFTAC